jgi:hypothetical protein
MRALLSLLLLAIAWPCWANVLVTVQPAQMDLAPGVIGTFVWSLRLPDPEPVPNVVHGYCDMGSSESNRTVFMRREADSENTNWNWPQPLNCAGIVGTANAADGRILDVPLAAGMWHVNLGTIGLAQKAVVSISVRGR